MRRNTFPFLIVCGTIIATSIAGITYTIVRTVVLESARQEASLKVQNSASHLDAWLRGLKSEITAIARTPQLRSQNWEIVSPYLRDVGRYMQEYNVLAYTLPDGTIYDTHIDKSRQIKDGKKSFKVSDRAWFRAALGGSVTASDPFVSRGTGLTQINIAAPVLDTSQQPVAILAGSITIERIEQELSQLRFGEGSYAFALNSRGQTIFHPDAKYRSTAERPGPLLTQSDNQDLALIARQMLSRQRGITLVRLNNNQEYLAYAPLQEANWSVAVVIPRHNVEGRLQSLDLLATCFVIALLAAAVGGWRQWQLSQKTNTQLQQLQEQERTLKQNQQSMQEYLHNLEIEQQKVEQANIEIGKLNAQLRVENLRMTAELSVARRLQEMILPRSEELEIISDLDVAGYMQPADEVGGDYYDVISRNGKTHIVIGDVTGHGLVSGVIMLMAQTAVRALLNTGDFHPTKFLQRLNETLYFNLKRIQSNRTMTLSILEYEDKCIRLTGQHESVLIVRADGSMEEIDTDELGFPIGLEEDITPFTQEKTIRLGSNDILALYTDGISEAISPRNEFYGLKKMHQIIKEHRHHTAQEICQALIADLTVHIEDRALYDDVTLLIVKQNQGSMG